MSERLERVSYELLVDVRDARCYVKQLCREFLRNCLRDIGLGMGAYHLRESKQK